MFIKVRAHVGFSKEAVLEKRSDTFEVFVKEKARQGDANKAILHLIARYLGVPASRIRFRKGAKSRSKILEIIDAGGKR